MGATETVFICGQEKNQQWKDVEGIRSSGLANQQAQVTDWILYTPPKFAPCLTFLLLFSQIFSAAQARTSLPPLSHSVFDFTCKDFICRNNPVNAPSETGVPSGCSVQNLGNAGRRAAPTNATLVGTFKLWKTGLLGAIAPDTSLLCLKTVAR